MKKIFSIALVAILMTSGCQKTEIIAPSKGEAIIFSTEIQKITKSDAVSDATQEEEDDEEPEETYNKDKSLQDQGFYIWTYANFIPDDVSNVDEDKIYDDMDGLKFHYSGGSWDLTPSKEYYWPGTGKELKFFAISSKDTQMKRGESGKVTINHGIPSETGAGENVGPSITIANFEVGPTASEDLMVADFLTQHQGERVVNLNFRHALSKIEFKFKTTPVNGQTSRVLVQAVEVANLNKKGTLTVTPKQSTSSSQNPIVNEVNFSWTSNTPDLFTATSDKSVPDFPSFTPVSNTPDYGTKALELASTEKTFVTWMMLPDTDLTDNMVTITYIINSRQFKAQFLLAGKKTVTEQTNEDGETEKVETYQISSWVPNQYVTYTIDLSPNMITFDASSQEWAPHTDITDQN